MKSLTLVLALAVASAGLAPSVADARRLGGGMSSGMQRSMPARTAPAALPARPAAPAAVPTTAPNPGMAAAAAPKRSWMGPLAGLAAGLGIAALMSHLGMGAGFGNMLTLLLVAAAAIFAIRFLLRRFGPGANGFGPGVGNGGPAPAGMQFAGAPRADFGAAAPAGANAGFPGLIGGSGASTAAPSAAAALAPALPVPAPALPPGFDATGFERTAKMIFIRMQAANDAGDLDDLRAFTTPEMFAVLRLELQERGAATQQTDVEKIDAEVLEVAEEGRRQIVSVRFHGLVREEKGGVAAPVDEVWHFVKPTDGSREWAIAGIQQSA